MKLLEAIEKIKGAGFGYVKVELEAQLNRGFRDCSTCSGSGRASCAVCSGDGYVETEECLTCEGVGVSHCTQCGGQGGIDYSLDNCKSFIRDYVGPEAWSKLNFARYYHDGSVDSEFTFTLPIDEASLVPRFIEAFREVGKKASRDGKLDVRGAGMHTALLLNSSNGRYPTYDEIPRGRYENFSRQMTRLMPALFFLASANRQTRPLRFREPRVSSSEKYSAIYSRGRTVLEYRVFETCYDKPEQFFDFLEVIGNSMQFLDPAQEAPVLNKEFYFPSVQTVGSIFRTTEQLEILMKQIKYLQPDKTIQQLKKERGVVATMRELKQIELLKTREIESDYKTYRELVKAKLALPLTQNEEVTVSRLVSDGYSQAQAEARVRRWRVGVTKTKSSFVKLKITPFANAKKVSV